MNIVQVCPYDLQRPGGVQRHVLDLSAALARAGHAVSVLAPVSPVGPGSDWATETPGMRIVPLGRFRLLHVLGTGFELSRAQPQAVRDALAQAQPDVVHFHTLWTPLMSWQVWHALRDWPRTARVATFHDTPPEGLSGDLMRWVFARASARLSRQLQAAIPVSLSPAAHLRLAPACARHILPACIDLSHYAPLAKADGLPAPGSDADSLAFGHRSAAAPQVLFLGRLEPRKGVLVMLQAFARVAARHPLAQLVVAGDGPLAEPAQALARELGIAGRTRFVGAVDEAAKRQWLGRATVFCAPSLYGESYGLVLTEAMAAGVPVIAAANSGYTQVLADEGAAGLVPPGDVPALAHRLDDWLADAALRERQRAWGLSACAAADVNRQLPVFERIYADAQRSKLEGSGR